MPSPFRAGLTILLCLQCSHETRTVRFFLGRLAVKAGAHGSGQGGEVLLQARHHRQGDNLPIGDANKISYFGAGITNGFTKISH
jgi:hypothetical protein